MRLEARRHWSVFLQPVLRRALHLQFVWMTCLCLVPAAQAEIIAARYADPTDRYGHNVLGAEGEYETLVVTLRGGREIRASWPTQIVFEDIAPRLADLDGDGKPEVIAVQSHESRGAQVAIYRFQNNRLRLAGTNDFIGTAFRWLAIVGAADLDGDGRMEIAYVDRPHLAKTLRVFTVEAVSGGDFQFRERANLKSVSNHRIGQDFITGGMRQCQGSVPEMLTADAGWQQIIVSRFDGRKIEAQRLAPFSPSAMQEALNCQ